MQLLDVLNVTCWAIEGHSPGHWMPLTRPLNVTCWAIECHSPSHWIPLAGPLNATCWAIECHLLALSELYWTVWSGRKLVQITRHAPKGWIIAFNFIGNLYMCIFTAKCLQVNDIESSFLHAKNLAFHIFESKYVLFALIYVLVVLQGLVFFYMLIFWQHLIKEMNYNYIT